MTLSAGTRLGNYEIVEPLGSGGMGEVYRARDVRLGRAVAIKALPEAFARDPDRLARFEREARVLASVHHSGIAMLFGIEDGDGTSYLALELVEGETLAQRIARAPLGVPETLEVGAQIAAALDAAHEQGIVHRDLKPGNVMVTASGAVKVLDFGLAKAGPAATDSSPDLSASPTVALGATAAGIVVGTASYMSPEQARGKPVDRRADVWALGCLLFECLTGRQAFAGETTSDVIARVLEREPEWGLLPAAVPARLRDVMRRCLTKNPADRPRDAGDLRGELLAIASDLSSPGRVTAARSGPPSLAVLYFQNHSTEAESDYFCDGITEDILTDLSKVKGMRVASRNAIAKYRGQNADVAKVAAELGVSAVLEGTVRRSGPRVRITVQLVSADGFQIWGERYDRTIEDVFAVQEEISSSIAGALEVALTQNETENLVQDRPKDVRAYDLYLKGREQYRHYTPESLNQAIRLFEQAIAVDPNYALAYAGIGDSYGQLLQWSDLPPEQLVARGLEAARRAIALNPKLPEGHKAEALVLGFSGQREASVEALKRAIQADPRFTPALGNLAAEWFRDANLAGAERLIRRSLELEPDDHHTMLWLAFVMTWTRRLDEALALLDRVRRMSDDPFYVTIVHGHRATVWALRHQAREVERCLEEGRADVADPANLAMIEAYLSTRKDRSDRAKQLLAEHGASTRLGFSALIFGAAAAFQLGDPERAAEMMRRRSIAAAAPTVMRLDPMLHPLLDLPAFAPRRADYDLIWPIEAPMIERTHLQLFRQVRLESGTPEGSDVLAMG